MPQVEFESRMAQAFRFHILGPDGNVVTAYRRLHERELHLIVVRHDLATFSHLHPMRQPDGTWEVELTLPLPGPYRAFADVAPQGGPDVTLAVDLTAVGEWIRQQLPAPSTAVWTDDYQVEFDGQLAAGAHSEIAFIVTRGGRAVALEPYLGALGHLVALRASDLGYLHVHPFEDSSSERVRFGVEVPSPGLYRLFIQFRHEARVRTASFTVEAHEAAGHSQAAHTFHRGPG